MRIKIKYFDDVCAIKPSAKGDWIDLRSRVDLEPGHNLIYIPLGVAMKLPRGYEAIVAPRSSTFTNYGFIMPNSIGVIDNTYCGDSDEWLCPALFLGEARSSITKSDRVCQFRIQLSQHATKWQKIKWMFSGKIKFIPVENLSKNSRGGFGSTGVK